ncbi:SRPBCC domain-containing protein [Micromonospora sp. NPDC048170]|uniref:SRPBCC family protein n=1 Tax=Micromonospora sp. NPDC048170 TaxID=3154819 RepID=UPI00340F1801
MSEPVIVEVTIAAPADTVWRALTEPEHLRRWHGWDADTLDDEIRAIYLDDVTISAEDLTLDTGAGRFELEPAGDTTVVRITRAAPPGHSTWDGIYDELNEGWLTFTQQLRFYLERHLGQERRAEFMAREIPVPTEELWFRSSHQVGVLIDDDGLLVVSPGATIVSTYGLDAGRHAQLVNQLTG